MRAQKTGLINAGFLINTSYLERFLIKYIKMTAYYLFSSLIDRIVDFFIHWYGGGFRMWSHSLISFMEALDRRLAFKITIKHLFQPLYQDRSFIGYILGFNFRCGRLIIGAVIYAIILIIAISIYLAWAAVPIYVVYKITEGLIIYRQ